MSNIIIDSLFIFSFLFVTYKKTCLQYNNQWFENLIDD